MTIYFLLYYFIFLGALFSHYRSFPESIFAVFVFLLLVLVIGFRYASVDYSSYQRIFYIVNDLHDLTVFGYPIDWSGNVEPGFALLILIFKSLNLNFYFFVFLFTFISFGIKYAAFKKMSPYMIVSLMVYMSSLFFKDLGQIRNAMASGIVLLSTYYLYHRKYLVHYILIFFAISIHFMSLLALFLYFLKYLNKKILIIILIGSLAIRKYIQSTSLVNLINTTGLVDVFPFLSKIAVYAQSQYFEPVSIFSGTNLSQFFIVLLLIYNYERLIKLWSFNAILVPMFIFYSSLMFLFTDFATIWARIFDMFLSTSMTIIFPSLLLIYKNKIFILFLISLYTTLLLFLTIVNGYVAEYQSIFQFLI